MSLADSLRARAGELGFPLCGFASVQELPHGEFVRWWIADGRAGEMSYIERGLEKRLDVARVLDGARSVITLGYPYRPPRRIEIDWAAEMRGRIAAYAIGTDYHFVVRERLGALEESIRGLAPGCRTLTYVDTGPILEREWASLASIGWIAKNTMLIHPHEGSWFFLAEILTTLDLEPSVPLGDRCGRCRRCLDLCPTAALDDYRIDARLCISYLTIEHRGVLPPEIRPQMGNWIFGCDVCQEVCPWNAAEDAGPGVEELYPPLPELLALTEDDFRARYRRSALKRAKRDGLLRNAAVALGNTGNPDALPALTAAIRGDPSPLVRGHAAWAAGAIGGRRAHAALDRARRDLDGYVRGEAVAALEVIGNR